MSRQRAADDAGFMKRQRQKLTAARDQLLQAAGNKGERAAKPTEAKEIEDDAQDLAQSEIDGTIDAVEERRLRAIERALAKIDDGTYGLSDVSGDPIPRARLEAMPEAILTIEEEEARERQQR